MSNLFNNNLNFKDLINHMVISYNITCNVPY